MGSKLKRAFLIKNDVMFISIQFHRLNMEEERRPFFNNGRLFPIINQITSFISKRPYNLIILQEGQR